MDPCVLYVIYCRLRKDSRKRRRWSVHPINFSRSIEGAFVTLYNKLRDDSNKFFNYFRMSISSFDELVQKVSAAIPTNQRFVRGLAFRPEEMLAMTLRYLGSGCSYQDIHYSYRVGVTTVSCIVPSTCRLIWVALQDEVFPKFTEDYWREIAAGFETAAHFPHCLGAIDGKHIRVVKPNNSGSLCFNYKSFFSLILLAVVDSNYRFLYIDVGAVGKESDSTIFQNSTFHEALQNGSLNIPKPSKISQRLKPVPYVYVADEAFGISEEVMRPFAGNHLSKEKRIFNYRLSTARRFVECSFGILSNKWRIFHRPLNLKYWNSVRVIKTACALHNYVRVRDGINFEDTLEINGLENSVQTESMTRGRKTAYAVRDIFADYFSSSEGSVPWQDNKI